MNYHTPICLKLRGNSRNYKLKKTDMRKKNRNPEKHLSP